MDHFRGVNTSPEKMNLQDKPLRKLECNPTCLIYYDLIYIISILFLNL